MNRRIHRMAILLLALALAGLQARAQDDFAGRKIDEVRISGLQRVNDQMVRSQLEVQAGQTFAQQAISRDIRRLYDTGHFANVTSKAGLEGAAFVITYEVQEKKIIQEIKITGADKVKTSHIRGVISWREGDSFDPEAYSDEREAIRKLCESKGFPNTMVDITVEEIGPSAVRIVYTVSEGRKARIKKVVFDGNETITDHKLRKLMKTKRSWWFLGGKYNEDTFEDDLANITKEYGNYGRLEAQVAGADFQYSPDGKTVEIKVNLAEGPEYTVGSMEAADNFVYDDDEIMDVIKTQAGKVHNQGQVEKDAAELEQGYSSSGYIEAQVTPQVTIDRENKTTHVVQRIEEGSLKYIQEVKITGNSITRDDVIRREVLSFPGERFDGALLKGTQQRIEGLEYFDEVRLTMEPLPGKDEFSNLLVDVEEGKTGYFNFGAGYSSEEKMSGYTEIKLENFDIANWPKFSGGGQQMRLKLQLGDVRSQYSLSFTDPEFLGRPLAFGFDLFNEEYNYSGGSDYSETQRGGQLRFGKVLSPYVTARTILRYQYTELSDLPWYVVMSSPREYRAGLDGTDTVSTMWGITRNTTNSKMDASSGSKHDFLVELAGLGGDNNFYKLQHDSQWYWSFDNEKKWILSYRTREGFADSYGSSNWVPIQDRFFAGGTTTVRGYDNRDIGPKRKPFLWWGDSEAVGGDIRIIQNLELKYKLTKQVRLYGFIDAGQVWADSGDLDLGDMKYGAGIGVGVDIPKMGPIRVDYGIPINPDDDQGNGRLHLQTGLRF